MTTETSLHELIEPKVTILVERYAEQLLDESTEVEQHVRNAAIIGCVMLADSVGNAKEWPNFLKNGLREQGIRLDIAGMSPERLRRMTRIAFASVRPQGVYDHEEVLDILLSGKTEDN